MCEIISASGLADKVGLGILTRRVPIDDHEVLVEENCDGESLLSARTLSAEPEIVIQTGWAFVASDPPDGGAGKRGPTACNQAANRIRNITPSPNPVVARPAPFRCN